MTSTGVIDMASVGESKTDEPSKEDNLSSQEPDPSESIALSISSDGNASDVGEKVLSDLNLEIDDPDFAEELAELSRDEAKQRGESAGVKATEMDEVKVDEKELIDGNESLSTLQLVLDDEDVQVIDAAVKDNGPEIAENTSEEAAESVEKQVPEENPKTDTNLISLEVSEELQLDEAVAVSGGVDGNQSPTSNESVSVSKESESPKNGVNTDQSSLTQPPPLISLDDFFASDDTSQSQDALPKVVTTDQVATNGMEQEAGQVIHFEDLKESGLTSHAKVTYICINPQCKSGSNMDYHRAPHFVANYYRMKRRAKTMVCARCFDHCVQNYGRLRRPLVEHQLTFSDFAPKANVEIIESSSEEENDDEDEDGMNLLGETAERFLAANLGAVLEDMTTRVNLSETVRQFEDSCALKLDGMSIELDGMLEEVSTLLRGCDAIYLHQKKKNISFLPEISIHVINEAATSPTQEQTGSDLPNMAQIKDTPCYAEAENKLYYQARILTTKLDANKEVNFIVQFQFNIQRSIPVQCHQLAYKSRNEAVYDRGTRVIAKKRLFSNSFSLGVIAECVANKYLIFFEDGGAQYVQPQDVRACWSPYGSIEDMVNALHLHSMAFIRKFFTAEVSDPQQPPAMPYHMKDQVKVYVSKRWEPGIVRAIENSLVTVYLTKKDTKETLYALSPRLRRMPLASAKVTETRPVKVVADEGVIRQVARKSTNTMNNRPRQAYNRPMLPVKNMNSSTIFIDEDDSKKGQIVYFVSTKRYSKPFVVHTCSPRCTPEVAGDLSKYNPLAQPLMAGWKRFILLTNSSKNIFYKGPCGRTMRNMYEVHHYLKTTHSPFNVDLFEFESDVQCLAEYKVEPKVILKHVDDLSDGQEPMPVSCVNYYDDTLPPACVYSTERIPTEGVHLNLDTDFLACCDCEDDCIDKHRCQCWQLTIKGARTQQPGVYVNSVGYAYKRLANPVPTGIYECNPRCKCKSTCLNRVVQHKIQLKLQVFKTAERGWGIRCLNDVPKGGFICVYAGHLLTEQKANEGGEGNGDEYFAELDYIEVVERLKDGYESEAYDSSNSESSESNESLVDSEDDAEYKGRMTTNVGKEIRTRSRHQMKMAGKKAKALPLRKLFGPQEEIYVMDAKITGNIGRYFNHSCAPNLFVQNVFVDTHDIRFPWVSFFALHNIRAGTELTWNYNYDVGSVPGKILICQCGAPTCRGRLL